MGIGAVISAQIVNT